MNLQIRDVKVILTAPEGINLVVVKVETNEPDLYGLGCATFTQRYLAVKTAIVEYMRPFILGKDPRRIEDIWQSASVSGYWRNGPVMNSALSGIDMALWDIKGKLAGMPVYDLLGGLSRTGAAVYRHVDGRDEQELEDNVRRMQAAGYKYLRCQMGGYGGGVKITEATNLSPGSLFRLKESPESAPPGAYFDREQYLRSVPRMFDHLRKTVGFDLELIHDIHERVAPIDALRLAKQLEEYNLFFLEDPVAPEDLSWVEKIRQQAGVPLAIGELFVHPAEWMPLIKNQLIDFIRCHVSAIGGITPARKLAATCEAFGIRTAWHGPGDVSPVGHAANVHLSVALPNFGIQEWTPISEKLHEVFPGSPEVKNGYVYPNNQPGLGIEIDEEKAAKYPCENTLPEWTLARIPDGTAVRP
ncbi:enolase C-terminal domain-like protein [Ammoniphilus resinae]|uniref:Mannonate dehydratase n=1 Tax=Ammoniphilus resinae TaxID=861532 RepID=A0ABS4GVJ9_9BACL|nr:enolase C-terminal domain-like protein [Ammoniphilus resinae]MBP1934298.1 mannonate dehydratase [Ammoniphilus resinae]